MLQNLLPMLGMRLDEVAETAEIAPLMRDSNTELIDDEFYMQMPRHGINFVATFEGRVSAIQLFSEGYERFSQFQGVLPEGIRFGDSRHAARDRLGRPDESGGGEADRPERVNGFETTAIRY